MIEIFRHNGEWRIKIVNETFEFDDLKQLEKELSELLEKKVIYEPYKHKEEK